MATQKQVNGNNFYQGTLRWTPGEIVAGATAVDADFVAGVEAIQRELKLTVDGIVGPATYSACLVRDVAEELTHAPSLELRGRVAVARAKISWLKDIRDDFSGVPVIDAMIRTTAGLNWTWEPTYTPDNYEWCGAFAAHAWRDSIPVKTRRDFWSSTYRLDRWAKYLPFESTPNPKPIGDATPRCIVELNEFSTPANVATFGGTGPRAGDILLVGGVNTAYGKHITVVESYDPIAKTFATIEGNAWGYGPHNNYRQGVIRGVSRPLGLPAGKPNTTYFARRLIRPAPGDLI